MCSLNFLARELNAEVIFFRQGELMHFAQLIELAYYKLQTLFYRLAMHSLE